jgi:GNAT superfamily N-acetyltransferase
MEVEFRAVISDRWPDLERLFRESESEELGNPSRCWCMEWRLRSHGQWREAAEVGGERNREAMSRLVASGEVPGIIAYVDGAPAGWCSVSPKPQLIGLARLSERLEGSHGDFDRPSEWAVICFYVRESQRGSGLMLRLLEAARDYAAEKGAQTVEGYPFEPEHATDGAGGTTTVFARAGFKEVRRLSEHQALMRWRRNPAEDGSA